MCDMALTALRTMFTRDKSKILTLRLRRPVCYAILHPWAAVSRFWEY